MRRAHLFRKWFAIAQLTGFLNLFNLIPVWQLDGSRRMHVLARSERWILVAAIAALMLTEQRLLFIVGAVAVWRALQSEVGPGDSRVLATFVMLVMALSLLARGVSWPVSVVVLDRLSANGVACVLVQDLIPAG